MTIRNLSTIQTTEIPAIRKLLEQDLKAHGVLVSGARECANAIRVTLSENARERLWVAEVVEGSENARRHGARGCFDSRRRRLQMRAWCCGRRKIAGLFNRIGGVVRDNPILAAAEINGHFVVMYADRISIFSAAAGQLDRIEARL